MREDTDYTDYHECRESDSCKSVQSVSTRGDV